MNKKLLIKGIKQLAKNGERSELIHSACIDEHKRYVDKNCFENYTELVVSNSLVILITMFALGIDSCIPYNYLEGTNTNSKSNLVTPSKILIDLGFAYRFEGKNSTYVSLNKHGYDYLNDLMSTIV